MNSVGFPISLKNNEMRRALLPSDLPTPPFCSKLFFEKGYGLALGIEDSEYIAAGANIASREQVLDCPVICDVKLGDADYVNHLSIPKLLVGWAHSVQGVEFASAVMKGGHSVIAWERIFVDGKYIFVRNREIAGEAAVMQAMRYSGKMPYDAKVAILGSGNTARGALWVLRSLGASPEVYGIAQDDAFRKQMFDYDIIVNCVLWDCSRSDRLIYRSDLAKMKKGTLIIDVSCNRGLEIETSHPTTIDDPVFELDGVVHYCVDNTPAMYPKTVTKVLSTGFAPFVGELVSGEYSAPLESAFDFINCKINNDEIRSFREARGLVVN